MSKRSKPRIDIWDLLPLLPAIASLVDEVIDAIKDGQVDGAEGKRIGDKLIALVRAL
jgi:hypothetical protein